MPGLREAIEDLSRGRTGEGFDKLDKFGVIHEIADDAGRLKAIAEKQIEAIEAQRSSLIIAPTHGECRAIAGAVRQVMKDKCLLSGAEHSVTRLERLNLTESQQRDAVTYEPGQVVEFHKIAKGAVWRGVREKRFKSGEQWEVFGVRREVSLSERMASRSSCRLTRRATLACLSGRRSRWQSATRSDSRKTSNTAGKSSSITEEEAKLEFTITVNWRREDQHCDEAIGDLDRGASRSAEFKRLDRSPS